MPPSAKTPVKSVNRVDAVWYIVISDAAVDVCIYIEVGKCQRLQADSDTVSSKYDADNIEEFSYEGKSLSDIRDCLSILWPQGYQTCGARAGYGPSDDFIGPARQSRVNGKYLYYWKHFQRKLFSKKDFDVNNNSRQWWSNMFMGDIITILRHCRVFSQVTIKKKTVTLTPHSEKAKKVPTQFRLFWKRGHKNSSLERRKCQCKAVVCKVHGDYHRYTENTIIISVVATIYTLFWRRSPGKP